MKKQHKIALGILLAIIVVVLLYLAGYFTETPIGIRGLGGFVEPKPIENERNSILVTDLTIHPAKVQPNEAATITVSVTNTYDRWAIYSLVLKINGVTEAEKQVNVDAGSREDVSFSVTRENPGRYTVFINGLSGSFTVVTRVPPP